jgi:alcohol dehydrogenase
LARSRLDAAKQFGADVVASPQQDVAALVNELTGGLGADVVIEAVGVPETFELCTTVVRAGGRSHRQCRRARQAGDVAP